MSHKQYLSQRIREQTAAYLAQGGHVHRAAPGASGTAEHSPRQTHQRSLTSRKSIERTPVPEVVAAIEARKQARRARSQSSRKKPTRQPRKRVIYDDFGEPVRWEWTND